MRIVRQTQTDNQQLNEGISSLLKQGTTSQPVPRIVRSAHVLPLVLGVLLLAGIIAAMLVMNSSLRQSRDTIRQNYLFTLRNAIELYKINHTTHYAPTDSSLEAFSAALIPVFLENLPTDPGNYSFFYIRDPDHPEQYTLGGKSETLGADATFRFGVGTLSIDAAGIDGKSNTAPRRGVEFGI